MQVMRKGRDSTLAWKVITDEGYTLMTGRTLETPLLDVSSSWHLQIPPKRCVRYPWLPDALQQVRNRFSSCVCRKAYHPNCAGADVDTVEPREDGVACASIERSNAGATADNEKPSLLFRFQKPGGVLR